VNAGAGNRPGKYASSPSSRAESRRLYSKYGALRFTREPAHRPLADGSRSKIGQKVIEEAGEVALDAVLKRESADLVYHLVLLWHACGIAPDEVWAEIRRRADRLGIAEKLPKGSGCHAPAIGFGK
jgi:phosphoribosyl-ATP pyrophosphohydrolase